MLSLSVEGNSLERISGYLNIDHEEEPKTGGEPPAYWPSSGDIRVENLSARYSADGPKVLNDISFSVKGGERVGIGGCTITFHLSTFVQIVSVGRTGSGKSSLTLSLLRCIPTEGTVYYDGIPTSSLNLDALRSKITIIPQAVRKVLHAVLQSSYVLP
jgi:ABC-type multidrug transport system fused ATPase/permease subunit